MSPSTLEASSEPLQAEDFNQTTRYEALMDVVKNRMTTREFRADYTVPDDHFEMILESARHGPSGANAQPWHYIVVKDPAMKTKLAEHFIEEQHRRIKLGMNFPTPNYKGMKTAPGLIVVASDFRFIKAFPVLKEDSPLNDLYKENAERILLQSVAASTMSAHLAAAALGYAVWWITAIGQAETQKAFKPLLGVPDALSIIDIMCFGPPKKPQIKRWKKRVDEIMSVDKFNMKNFWSDEKIENWIKNERHRVMYKDESKID